MLSFGSVIYPEITDDVEYRVIQEGSTVITFESVLMKRKG